MVDKGKKRKKQEGLKLDNKTLKQVPAINEEDQPALDAELVDVYKGTNGVIIMLDMTKQWTFDYVQREIVKIPQHIPVLVLANHRDMGHHRVVTEDQVRTFIENLDRPEGSGQIRYSETSMRNSFGLKFLHKFFNLPFLHLQRETLIKQLETNYRDIQTTCEELDLHQESEEQNYELFLDLITNKRRQIADQLSQIPQKPVCSANGTIPPRSISMPANIANKAQVQPEAAIVKPTPSIIIGAQNPLPQKFSAASRNSSNTKLGSINQVLENEVASKNSSSPSSRRSTVKSVEDFVPEDEQAQFRSFLEEQVDVNESYDLKNLEQQESER